MGTYLFGFKGKWLGANAYRVIFSYGTHSILLSRQHVSHMHAHVANTLDMLLIQHWAISTVGLLVTSQTPQD